MNPPPSGPPVLVTMTGCWATISRYALHTDPTGLDKPARTMSVHGGFRTILTVRSVRISP